MTFAPLLDRRGLLVAAAALSTCVAGCVTLRLGGGDEAKVAPVEDLMREHGVLERVLLVYEEAMRRPEPAWPAVAEGAEIVRTFIEEYHERLEEEHLFPRLEQAGSEVGLVATLRRQHEAGRALTRTIAARAAAPSAPGARQAAGDAIAAFIRMYRPHAAREDTVLFPAFRRVIPEREYAALGERFEEREHRLFGTAGFAGVVARVEAVERGLGIAELDRFTPG